MIMLGITRILFLLYNSLNMANTSEIFSDFFNNISSKVDIHSAFLSTIETKADTGLVSVNYIMQTSRLIVSKICYYDWLSRVILEVEQ
jgi:hypothetical protein